jgi:hypothetical protein
MALGLDELHELSVQLWDAATAVYMRGGGCTLAMRLAAGAADGVVGCCFWEEARVPVWERCGRGCRSAVTRRDMTSAVSSRHKMHGKDSSA